MEQLRATVKAKAICSSTTPENILNAQRETPTYQSDIRSLWSILLGSLEPLVAKLLEGEENLELKMGDIIVNTTKPLVSCGSLDIRTTWKRATDQGRCANHVSLHPSSNHWMNIGKYLFFSACRLAIIGRLNLLLVRAAQERTRSLRGTINCRKCHSQPETLAHVLHHCHPAMGLIRERRAEILRRLQCTIPRDLGEIFLE